MLTGKPVSEEGGTSSDGVDGLGSDRTSLSDLLSQAEGGETRTLCEGEYLWRQGDVADAVALLRAGTLEVIAAGCDGHETVVVRDLRPGAVLGEISCLDGGARSADIRAGSKSVVICYPATAFRDLLRQRPRLMELLLLQQVETVRRLTAQVTQHHQCAITDPLTGLYNLAFFAERLALELDRARQTLDPLAVVMFDLDHFKRFNDNFGHQAGNAALQRVAAIFRSASRRGDIIARYGGEEFIVLLYGADAMRAHSFAERVRSRVAAETFGEATSRAQCHLTLSAGIACFPAQPGGRRGNADSLILDADNQLYRAKQEGRNRVVGGIAE